MVSLIVCVAGFTLAYLYGHKVKKFRLSEFLLLIAAPLLVITYKGLTENPKILYLFGISMFVGTFLEYGYGWLYNQVLNKKLWTYSRYNYHGYISWLNLPVWGIAGFVFWKISQLLGL